MATIRHIVKETIIAAIIIMESINNHLKQSLCWLYEKAPLEVQLLKI